MFRRDVRTRLTKALRERDPREALRLLHKTMLAGGLSPHEQAWAHFHAGEIQSRPDGDREAAMAAFREAIACDPAVIEAHYNLGVLLYEEEDLAGAVEAFHGGLRIEPAHRPCGQGLAHAIYNAGDLDLSRALLEASLDDEMVHHRHGPTLHNLAEILARSGERERAMDLLAQAALAGHASSEQHLADYLFPSEGPVAELIFPHSGSSEFLLQPGLAPYLICQRSDEPTSEQLERDLSILPLSHIPDLSYLGVLYPVHRVWRYKGRDSGRKSLATSEPVQVEDGIFLALKRAGQEVQ